jgi:hypothetical protein
LTADLIIADSGEAHALPYAGADTAVGLRLRTKPDRLGKNAEEVSIMKMRVMSLLVLFFLLTGLFGCASIPEEHKGAATGAAVGGATGAVAGAVLGKEGSKTGTAVIGGLLGALVGGAIGHYAYDKKRSQEETAQRYEHQPSSGTMVRIEETSVVPQSVRPGEKVELKVVYAVLGASAGSEMSITEIREVRYGDELVGKPEVTVKREGGTYTSTIPLFLPADAKTGTYRVLTTIQTGGTKDARETTFKVT